MSMSLIWSFFLPLSFLTPQLFEVWSVKKEKMSQFDSLCISFSHHKPKTNSFSLDFKRHTQQHELFFLWRCLPVLTYNNTLTSSHRQLHIWFGWGLYIQLPLISNCCLKSSVFVWMCWSHTFVCYEWTMCVCRGSAMIREGEEAFLMIKHATIQTLTHEQNEKPKQPLF